ncbi:MAG TPA: 50S ribosomal protein L6 [Patescibacteria group bacterium]|jgi:large subunit ribosomal protein L6|nr:50S ribosomal protein L6 [Patescibacteria group bacterium]
MSRIGKKPVILPAGVTVELNGNVLTVKGPKGTLTQEVHPKVTVTIGAGENANEVIVDVAKHEDKREKALWGLFRSLVQNMVDGVNTGYTKQLDVVGVGFKAEVRGTTLVLNLGFSHQIDFEIAPGVEVKVEKDPAKVTILQYQTTITLTGIDKQVVGQVAANIRELKKPEPYKGKGIKYSDEVIIRKAGKVVKAVGK